MSNLAICKTDMINYQGLTASGTALATGIIYYNTSKTKKHKLLKTLGYSILSGILTAGVLKEVVCKNKYDLIEPPKNTLISVQSR